MQVVVMGAGVVGVTTAWYLRQQGHDVTVIDRQALGAICFQIVSLNSAIYGA